MKKYLALLMAVLMLFSITVPVTAHDVEGIHDSVPEFGGYGVDSVDSSDLQPVDLPDGLYSYVVSRMRTCDAVIDISSYKIDSKELHALMMDITNSEPELFQLENDWEYYTDNYGRYITTFTPTYSMSFSRYTEALAQVRKEADRVISYVDRSWSNLEKALYLHDYLIAWYEYDNDLSIRNIYDFIRTGEGVCEAYQLYYMYLLNKLNIPNDYIVSEPMNHVWNRVSIGGSWYNVDVTWDEPNNNHMAETKHNYFLVSDAAMQEHYGGVSDKACTGRMYDNHSWKNTTSAIVPLNGKWYTIMDNYICEYVPGSGATSKVFELTDRWPSDQDGYIWTDYLSGLSAYKGCLIFITHDSFMAYNPALGIAKKLATLTEGGFLFDGVVDPETGKYYVTIGDSRYHDGVTKFYQIKEQDLPLTVTWEEYARDAATCINPGVIYYRAQENHSVTKTETFPATGHTPGDDWYYLSDGEGNVSALYQYCNKCAKRCNLTPVVPTDFNGKFSDVKLGDWYTASVAFAVDRGLFGGMSATKFAPNTDMSRAMLVTVLWRMEGSPAPLGANPFTDVKAGQWYTDAVIWAYENNIVGGVGNGKFATNNTITREQLATILYRYAQGKGYALDLSAGISNFPDTNRVSSYAIDSYSWARSAGIIDGMSMGDGQVHLNPNGYATRAQVATMLTRFIVFVAN